MGIAMPAVAAAAEDDRLTCGIEIGEHGLLIIRKNLRADGDFDAHVRRAGAGAVGAGAVAALPGAEMLGVAEVDEGVQVLGGFEDDVAAAAAVTAVRAAEFDEALAPEGDDAVAPIAGADVDLGLVEEFHVQETGVRRQVADCSRPLATVP